ncbi:Tetratricopeptide repeat protein 12 [Lonchura striata]|uniref:Tetratricopeptide repeat protein 12 n=1 Tax=Lonchura striata TaxID=40157 RepID=A0A218UQ29_9PASE|nr:Tetratricopeptide repeat protein 12 [Lonchura striata domestica]
MLRDQDTEADFQRFLRRVDDVTNLLQDLKSPDSAVQEKAIAEVEKRLQEQGAGREEEEEEEEESRTTVNRTLINTSGTARVEAADAALKEQGNEAFRAGDFALAIQSYSEGLEKLRDKQELYTNRAQAYLKLHEYEKAISDCEWALKCNRNCLKAYFLMGKAHLALQHFAESRQCYEKMLQIDPQKEKLVKACVDEARLEEKRLRDEEGAAREAQAGSAAASSIQELLQRLSSPGHDILYYTGGIRLLAEVVSSCTGQTLFRTNKGFSILSKEPVRGAFCAEAKSPAEAELCVSLLVLWRAACAGNEENQRLLLAQPEVSAQLPELLSCGTAQMQREALALISLYSEHQSGRGLLVRQDLSRWLHILMAFVKCTDARAESAMNILSDLAGEERFQTQCRAMLSTDVLPLFTQLLDFAVAISGSCLALLNHQDGKIITDFAVAISGSCLALLNHQDGKIITRALGVLSRALPASPAAVQEAVQGGVVRKMLKFLKAGGRLTSSYAIKTLSACTQSSRRAQQELQKWDKRFQVLLRLLDSGDELTVGNAAFSLGQCLLLPGAASSLLGSNVVQLLLRHAGGDALRTSVQKNSAIALARLCVAEPRHMHQLRKLNGLAILNSSMKYVHSS